MNFANNFPYSRVGGVLGHTRELIVEIFCYGKGLGESFRSELYWLVGWRVCSFAG